MSKHTAFITGAGRNIGRAIALELARRGMNVVIVGRSDIAACETVAANCRGHGAEALVLTGDLGRRDECERMANDALSRFGTLDVLVTCAAIRPHMSLLETSDDQWAELLAVNLNSAFWLAKAFIPGMIEQGWGRVIGFTGMNAVRGAHKGPVGASKHAQWGLIKAISYEFASQGVTANVISPGPIVRDGAEDEARRGPILQIIPMGRRGTAAEVAALAGLLASEEGSYISGQMISVNGGGTV